MEVDRIAEVFKDKNVFITGATGFMGKVFLERILRVTKVKKVFMLIRSKRNATPEDRLNKMLEDPLFDKLKVNLPIAEILQKVHLIYGDCGQKNLDISSPDRALLNDNVSMIFHFAATVKFTEKFKRAIELNVRGTREVIQLALDCKNIEIFCYVSTAYCHLSETHLLEKCYEPPANPHDMISIAESYNLDEVEVKMSRYLCDNMPNSYSFTKALSENLVAEADRVYKLPVMICRPPIVLSTYSDPVPGWTDNMNNLVGFSIAVSMGLLRSVLGHPNTQVNMTTVDYATSNIMAATWRFLSDKKKSIFIVNLKYEPLRLCGEMETFLGYARNLYPMDNALWYPRTSFTTNRVVHYARTIFEQWIPAAIGDLIVQLMRKKTFLLDAHKQLAKNIDMMDIFRHDQWSFDFTNTTNTYELMNSTEKLNYSVDDRDIDEFLKYLLLGIRRYIFKQSDEGLSNARKRIKIFYFIEKILAVLLLCGFLYLISKLF